MFTFLQVINKSYTSNDRLFGNNGTTNVEVLGGSGIVLSGGFKLFVFDF